MSTEEVTVTGWPPPKGYANGRIGHGRVLHVGGQIGWNAQGELPPPSEFVQQFAQALDNVLAVVRAAGGVAEDIASMTVYVSSVIQYRGVQRELGAVWRERLGKHFPAMALLGVSDFVEKGAVVEIQAVAYLGDRP